jgi:hypothetical protein
MEENCLVGLISVQVIENIERRISIVEDILVNMKCAMLNNYRDEVPMLRYAYCTLLIYIYIQSIHT